MLVESTSGLSAVNLGVVEELAVPVFPVEAVVEVEAVPVEAVVVEEPVPAEVFVVVVDEAVVVEPVLVPADVLVVVVVAVEAVVPVCADVADVFPVEEEPVFAVEAVSLYSSGSGAPVYPQKFPFWSRFKSVFERSIER